MKSLAMAVFKGMRNERGLDRIQMAVVNIEYRNRDSFVTHLCAIINETENTKVKSGSGINDYFNRCNPKIIFIIKEYGADKDRNFSQTVALKPALVFTDVPPAPRFLGIPYLARSLYIALVGFMFLALLRICL